ncbi:MAG: DUF4258 domain-containing protein [Desulfurococcales archaeon]|nr:DUF4258 domain-containing protein [Desulfurococcales archaeon]
MKIHNTLHALERMRQRGIRKDLVEQCVRELHRDERLDDVKRCIERLDGKVLALKHNRGRAGFNNFVDL